MSELCSCRLGPAGFFVQAHGGAAGADGRRPREQRQELQEQEQRQEEVALRRTDRSTPLYQLAALPEAEAEEVEEYEGEPLTSLGGPQSPVLVLATDHLAPGLVRGDPRSPQSGPSMPCVAHGMPGQAAGGDSPVPAEARHHGYFLHECQ